MGCDWTVHIWDDLEFDEDVIRALMCSSLGSKYFTMNMISRKWEEDVKKKYGKDHYDLVANTPSYEIGEVSFLKRGLTGDDSFLYGKDAYINLFDGDPEPITQGLIDKCNEVDKELAEFLKNHIGKKCFTVCW